MPIDISLYSDRRDVPRYNLANAASYLGIKTSTLRSWVKGRRYSTRNGIQYFTPLIEPAFAAEKAGEPILSFFNIAEAHVLSAIRKEKKLSFSKIRTAIDFIAKEFQSSHPLIANRLFTDGVDLFVKALLGTKHQHVVNASRGGQLALKEILETYLERIDRDSDGLPVKVFPLVVRGSQPSKVIVITPDISSGQPVVDHHGIRALVIWDRHQAGESVDELAEDYGIKRSEVEAAIEYINSIEHTDKAA